MIGLNSDKSSLAPKDSSWHGQEKPREARSGFERFCNFTSIAETFPQLSRNPQNLEAPYCLAEILQL
jgi:hypothetical protein